MCFSAVLFSYCTFQHKPHLQLHHSLLKCCSVGTLLFVGLFPSFQTDLIMIDGICTNGAPKLLSALKRSVAFSLINLFVRSGFSLRMREVYISHHMFRHKCLFTWTQTCKELSWQFSRAGVGIIFYIKELVNSSFVLRCIQFCRGVCPGAFISTWLFYRPSRSF